MVLNPVMLFKSVIARLRKISGVTQPLIHLTGPVRGMKQSYETVLTNDASEQFPQTPLWQSAHTSDSRAGVGSLYTVLVLCRLTGCSCYTELL
jgi:hypothetical protein